jgi:hypothetical protein
MTRKAHALVSVVAASATLALLVVPAALAESAYPDAFERAVNARNAERARLDATAYPDAFERAVAAHRASASETASPGRPAPDLLDGSSAPVAVPGDGFDWASAAIGSSAALVVLLVGGGALATRHSRGRVAVR